MRKRIKDFFTFLILPHKFRYGFAILLLPILSILSIFILKIFFGFDFKYGWTVTWSFIFYVNIIWHIRVNKWYMKKRKKVYYRVTDNFTYYLPLPKNYIKKENGIIYMNPRELSDELFPIYKPVIESLDGVSVNTYKDFFIGDHVSPLLLFNDELKVEFTFDPIFTVNKRNTIIDDILSS